MNENKRDNEMLSALDVLSDPEQPSLLRQVSAWTLGREQADYALEELKDVAKDPDHELREAVAWALGTIGTQEARNVLADLVRDTDPIVRCGAAKALGKIRDPGAITLIVPLLKDHDPMVSGAAAEALGEIGGPQAILHVAPLLQDPDCDSREAAIHALEVIGGPLAIERIEPMLSDEEGSIRAAAVVALAELQRSEALEKVIAALDDPDPGVRETAARLLEETGTPEAEAFLKRACHDPDPGVAEAVQDAHDEIRSRTGHVSRGIVAATLTKRKLISSLAMAACLLIAVSLTWHSRFWIRKPVVSFGAEFENVRRGDDGIWTNDKFKLITGLKKPAYVYIIAYDSNAEVTLLFPDEGETALLKDEKVYLPPGDSSWQLTPPGGTQALLCIASSKEIQKPHIDELIKELPRVGKIPDLPGGVELKLRDEGWVKEVEGKTTVVRQEKLESLRTIVDRSLRKYRPAVRGLAFLQREE